ERASTGLDVLLRLPRVEDACGHVVAECARADADDQREVAGEFDGLLPQLEGDRCHQGAGAEAEDDAQQTRRPVPQQSQDRAHEQGGCRNHAPQNGLTHTCHRTRAPQLGRAARDTPIDLSACPRCSSPSLSAKRSASLSPVVSTPPSPSRGCERRAPCPSPIPATSGSTTRTTSPRSPAARWSTAP